MEDALAGGGQASDLPLPQVARGGVVEQRGAVAEPAVPAGLALAPGAPEPAAAAAPAPALSDDGGPVLNNVRVVLCFWGDTWAAGAAPSVADVTNAFAGILSGPYMGALNQYRGIGPGQFWAGSPQVFTTPAIPQPFGSEHVAGLLLDKISRGLLPPPAASAQLLYCVVMPPGAVAGDGNLGEHTYFDLAGRRVRFAWVGNDGTLDTLTGTFSHELAESVTDPEGTAFHFSSATCRGSSAWCEVGDVCYDQLSRVGSTLVQAYWSQQHGACVAPTVTPTVQGWALMPGGTLTGGMNVCANADGRLQLFGVGTDTALWTISQAVAGGAWGGWTSLGGQVANAVAVRANQDGRLQAVVRGMNAGLWTIAQTTAGGAWGGWNEIGAAQIRSRLAAATNADGRLEVFAQGALDNALWHAWQTTPGGAWSGWASLGGQIAGALAVGANADGRLEALVQGLDDAVWHIWQAAPGGNWANWEMLGGQILGSLAVAANVDGRLEAFAWGAVDGNMFHMWQGTPNGGWSGWQSLGRPGPGPFSPVPAAVAVAANADGRLQLFVVAADSTVWTISQDWNSGTGWGSWQALGGQRAQQLAAVRNADGRIGVCAVDPVGAVWYLTQDAANGGWGV